MLIIKTDNYKFSTKEQEGYNFLSYMMDKYKWGGAKVEHHIIDGISYVSIEYVIETDEIQEFQEWKENKK